MIDVDQARDLAQRYQLPTNVSLDTFREAVDYELEGQPVVEEAARLAAQNLRRSPYHYHFRTFSLRNGKAQWIRVLDVVLIGPLMVAGGVSLARNRPFWGVLLGAMGLGTIAFNARNFLALRGDLPGLDSRE